MGKDLMNGFSKLAPHPDRSAARPARPLSLTACSGRLWGPRWHQGPWPAAAVAGEPGRAA